MRNRITDTSKMKIILISALLLMLGGCSALTPIFNPFYEIPEPVAMQGELNDSALRDDKGKIDTARAALGAMSTYQRAAAPQPVNPVINPAVVRVMWVPDHLNKNGDLVPAHYYYLKVLSDRWAVSDAFELEGQLNGPRGASADASSIPFVYDSEARGK